MNRLSKETSPYLLQHKDNPVDWFAWNSHAWDKAKLENKLVLISIGYSACHWCHVMEHEVFEDFECAEIMNRNFVCIKVDREERPDIDQIYMDAVHLMGSQGGWPLNVFALPDGRPVFGGTYFPKKNWINILENLIDLYKTDYQKVTQYASQLQDGLLKLNEMSNASSAFHASMDFVHQKVAHWSQYWDELKGGGKRAPKFPMPNNWEFLLDYALIDNNHGVLDFVHLTLEKMALGGIYDQIGGGFARYSVDDSWKVPHFEKMLYDNAQLITLYARALRQSGKVLYRDVVEQTIQWLRSEMKSEVGLYYAALDADSEGEEGRYYVWSDAELKEVLGQDYEFAASYYRIGKEALWEHNNNILLRNESDEDFSLRHKIDLDELRKRVDSIREKLSKTRSERIRPGLDHKCIASWNGLALKAFCEAHKALPQNGYIDFALELSEAIWHNFVQDDFSVMHVYTRDNAHIHGFLDDYVFIADGFLSLFEITGEELYAHRSKQLVEYSLEHFSNESGDLCFYTSDTGEKLIARKIDTQDNVIPAANSVLSRLLKKLFAVFGVHVFKTRSENMDHQMGPFIDFASGYSNWLNAIMTNVCEGYEVVICGPEAVFLTENWNKEYQPQVMAIPLTKESSLPVFEGRYQEQTVIYVCTQSHCLPPVKSLDEARKLIQNI